MLNMHTSYKINPSIRHIRFSKVKDTEHLLYQTQ